MSYIESGGKAESVYSSGETFSLQLENDQRMCALYFQDSGDCPESRGGDKERTDTGMQKELGPVTVF